MGEWRTQAACRGLDPDLFFPDDDHGAELAKELCRHCDVQIDCLNYAQDTRMTDGIWGGLDPRERRIARRRQGVA